MSRRAASALALGLLLALVLSVGALPGTFGSDVAGADLVIEPADGPNGDYAHTTDGHLVLDLSEGVSHDAVTRIDAVFTVTNDRSSSVPVWIDDDTDAVTFYDSATGESVEGEAAAVSLAPGETLVVGVRVDSTETDPAELESVDSFAIEATLPETATPTATPTATSTPIGTSTPTGTPTPTPTATPTETPNGTTPTPTETPNGTTPTETPGGTTPTDSPDGTVPTDSHGDTPTPTEDGSGGGGGSGPGDGTPGSGDGDTGSPTPTPTDAGPGQDDRRGAIYPMWIRLSASALFFILLLLLLAVMAAMERERRRRERRGQQ